MHITNEGLKDQIKTMIGSLQKCNTLVKDAKILLDQIHIEPVYEEIRVIDLYETMTHGHRLMSTKLISSLSCPSDQHNRTIQVDLTLVQNIVNKVLSLAEITGRKVPEIYLNVRLIFRNTHGYSLEINIRDCGEGFASEVLSAFNLYMCDEIDNFVIPGYPNDELRKLRFMTSRSGVSLSVSSRLGRGNEYLLVFDHEEQMEASIKQAFIKGYILNEKNDHVHLESFYRAAGIDLKQMLLIEAQNQLDTLSRLNFVIVEFDQDFSLSLEICKKLTEANKSLVIIPAYSHKQGDWSHITDALYDLRIRQRPIFKPYGPKSVLEILRGEDPRMMDIHSLLENFKK
jgi:hypothetical protein